MTDITDCEILQELVTVPTFTLQRVRQRNGRTYLLKQYFQLPPEGLRSLQLSVALSKQQGWKQVLMPEEALEFRDRTLVFFNDVAGESLRPFILQHAPLTTDNFLPIAIALVNMVAEIHQSGWIIKNLCPETILLLQSEHKCILTDVRNATKVYKKDALLTTPDEAFSLPYISPEQTGRLNRETDYRSDYYALGCMFYELLTGQPLFPYTDMVTFIYSLMAAASPSPMALNASVPASIDAIIKKLVAKNPDERYQSINGILVDLQQCMQQDQPFILAKNDEPQRLMVSEKLIGREEELQLICNAATLAAKGTKQVVYIRGYSGIGKTRLVAEFQHGLFQENQRMVAAKFDILQKDTPYSAINMAVKELVRQVLKEDEIKLLYWKERLLHFLNDNGQLIIIQVPELNLIIGEQPKVNELPPEEAQSRFLQTCINFVRAFTTDAHVLTVFLDDLQWADIASIKLIEMIVLDHSIKNFLFIGAYRDQEVSLSHPLSISLQRQEQWIDIKEIQLAPLKKEDVYELIRSSLGGQVKNAEELVNRIYKKTSGNTFFVIQLLVSLYEEKSLVHNTDGIWEWNAKAIERLTPTQDVADLLVQRLRNLGESLKEIIKCAACLGDVFDLKTMAHLVRKSTYQLAQELTTAINEGFVISLDDQLETFLKAHADDVVFPQTNTRFKFAHDRVRQAALSLLGPAEMAQLNLEAGKYKCTFLTEAELQNDIFYLANNFNLGAELINDQKDIAQLVDINFKAGIRAKNASAYEAAITYFAAGKKYLSFEQQYQVMYSFCLETSICKLLTGHYEEAEHDLDLLFERAISRLDKLNVLFQKVYLYTLQDMKVKAVETGRLGYTMYGLRMPHSKPAIMAMLLMDLLKAHFVLTDKMVTGLVDRDLIKDKEIERFLEFILAVAPPLYQYDQNLFALNTMKMVSYSLKYGNNGVASFGYLGYGMIIAQLFGKYEKGKKLADVAIILNNRLAYTSLKWKIQLSYYNFVHHWTQPIRPELDKILETENGAYANGDPIFAGYAIFIYHQKRFALGFNLNDLQQSFEEYLKLVNRRRDMETAHFLEGYYHAILCLRGIESDTGVLGEGFNAPEKIPQLIASSTFTVVADTFIAYLSTLYLFGHYAAAYEHYVKSLSYMEFIQQRYEFAEFNFYGALICVKALELKLASASHVERKIKNHLSKLKQWQENCPQNFEPQWLIASAEWLRIKNRKADAAQLFEKAISSAENFLFTNYKALACERAGDMALASGNTMMAKTYLETARQSFLLWGALAKVKKIESDFKSLFGESMLKRESPKVGSASLETMDIALILQTAQSVKNENDIDRLIEQLMKSIVQVVGADKAFLLIKSHSDLVLKACYNDEAVTSVTEYPDGSMIPLTLIRYVVRLKEPLISNNPSKVPEYGSQPYFQQHHPRCVLCYPILKQGAVFGILYFENYLSEDVFNADRIATLNFISSQMAIVLDNAHLYKNLDSLVRERTSEITAQMDVSDALLLNVLPKEAIEELKKTGRTKAQKFEQVTVLMADIKGFTLISEKLTPEELIQKIDFYFRAFDTITTKYGLEKIKTIGDAYMAAGGLGSDPIEGVKATISAALDMQAFMQQQPTSDAETSIALRIGIHTGTVIAGVVGAKKFQYDIWGDTVNVAARMEQCSEPGRVNISQVTREMAGNGFRFLYRGKIDAKNKGELDMYFVE